MICKAILAPSELCTALWSLASELLQPYYSYVLILLQKGNLLIRRTEPSSLAYSFSFHLLPLILAITK